MRNKNLAAILAWYFLVHAPNYAKTFTVVGPFFSQAQCENYRQEVDDDFWARITYPCWSSDSDNVKGVR